MRVGRAGSASARDAHPTSRMTRVPDAPSEAVGGLPRASRRRGPGEDSTGRVRRRKAILRIPHGSIRASATMVRGCVIATAHPAADARRRLRLTPLSGASYHPPDDDAPCARGAPARLRASRGRRSDRPRGRMERIPGHVPMKQTYQPKKRHRAKEHGFRARMKTTSGSPYPRRTAGSRSEAADGLTIERGTHPPRLVMLSRPQDFAAIQERGNDQVPPPVLRPVPADRPRDDAVRPVDRPPAGRRGRPEPGPPPTPRGAQGDGALVPARLGRPHHRPARDRRGRP